MFQKGLGISHSDVGLVLGQIGKSAEAKESFGHALAIQKKLADDNPTFPAYKNDLATSHTDLADTLHTLGEAAAVRDSRRATLLYESLPSHSWLEWFELACCHAALAGAAQGNAPGISASEAEAEAGRAMNLLRRAITEGYRDGTEMAREFALNSVRQRADFQLLMLDLAFPDRPFAVPAQESRP